MMMMLRKEKGNEQKFKDTAENKTSPNEVEAP